jgi:phenylalanyl-tRNA synthetase beta chain
VRIPLSWLQELCPHELSLDELTDVLAMKGAHTESVLHPWEGLEGVIVARVLDVREHPASETLCVARVRTDVDEAEVVVGVRNMAPDDLVPFAPPGARVPALPEPLRARPIRGVVSNGMLCSARELAISQDHGGILVLRESDLAPGVDVRSALGLDDIVLDLEIEPNRPDLLSVVGVAREVAGATGAPLLVPELALEEADEEAATVASVEVKDPDGCPRYVARVIRSLGGGSTPVRAQARLSAAGMRPISPAVDATNYVMLELGQPLHAFDLERVAGSRIVVRRAESGERMTTLDDVERTFEADDLLICDADGPVGIAGVIGGASSEVHEGTREVLLESAYFEARGILRTSRRLNVLTEASVRFSRGTDPEGAPEAAARAADLMTRWSGGGQILRGAMDVGAAPPRRYIIMRPSRASALLGYPVSASGTVEGLARIMIPATRTDSGEVRVEIPGFRPDLEGEVDVIEEIVRVDGYDRLPSTVPGVHQAGGEQDSYRRRRRVRELQVRAGLREASSLSFASATDLDLMGDAVSDAVVVANPPSAEEPFLRTSLIPSLLRAAARNVDRGSQTVALFEVGHVFRVGDPVDEREHVAALLAGHAGGDVHADDRAFDVLDAKGVVESLLEGLGIRGWTVVAPAGSPFHPTRSAEIRIGDDVCGVLGELRPSVGQRMDLPWRVALAEIDLDALAPFVDRTLEFHDVPRFPPVRRDLAFIVAEDVAAGDVGAAIRDAGGELLSKVVLFDVFRGGSLPEGTRSLAFALEFRAPDRTLTGEETEPVAARIVSRLAEEFGAELRAG